MADLESYRYEYREAHRNTSFGDRFLMSWNILVEEFRVLFRHPILFLPIFLSLVLSISVSILALCFSVAYFASHPDMKSEDSGLFSLGLSFIAIFLYCVMTSISVFLQLEFIQQIETGSKIDIGKAFYETLCKNLLKSLPIIFVWTIISFLLNVLGRGRKGRRNILGTFVIRVVKRIFGDVSRLTIFFIYPAIAWEDKDCKTAVKKGLRFFKMNLAEVVSGEIQLGFISFLLMLPIIFIVMLIPLFIRFNFVLTPEMKPVVICVFVVYSLIISNICFYLEQMFVSMLYLWCRKWEKAAIKAAVNKTPIPSIYDIPKPSMLDDVNDLL